MRSRCFYCFWSVTCSPRWQPGAKQKRRRRRKRSRRSVWSSNASAKISQAVKKLSHGAYWISGLSGGQRAFSALSTAGSVTTGCRTRSMCKVMIVIPDPQGVSDWRTEQATHGSERLPRTVETLEELMVELKLKGKGSKNKVEVQIPEEDSEIVLEASPVAGTIVSSVVTTEPGLQYRVIHEVDSPSKALALPSTRAPMVSSFQRCLKPPLKCNFSKG